MAGRWKHERAKLKAVLHPPFIVEMSRVACGVIREHRIREEAVALCTTCEKKRFAAVASEAEQCGHETECDIMQFCREGVEAQDKCEACGDKIVKAPPTSQQPPNCS